MVNVYTRHRARSKVRGKRAGMAQHTHTCERTHAYTRSHTRTTRAAPRIDVRLAIAIRKPLIPETRAVYFV